MCGYLALTLFTSGTYESGGRGASLRAASAHTEGLSETMFFGILLLADRHDIRGIMGMAHTVLKCLACVVTVEASSLTTHSVQIVSRFIRRGGSFLTLLIDFR